MSHRTSHLPPLRFPLNVIRELRYHEASRQLFAIILIVIFAIFGRPSIEWLFWLSTVLIIVGTLVRLWASGHVKKNKQLATDGPYALVRHPLYVGNILMLFGFAITAELWWTVPLVVALLLFYYPPAIQYEDRKLNRLFGDDWVQWRESTKTLLPSWPPAGKLSASWSFKQSLLGNGEPVIVVFAAYCCYHLFTFLP
ncbi:MAG: isoprenylcysteine carboxylmethyltransferase family protein [Gammaproteobacteria bacterium]|nr:isoprenylcysteine carboxylmethyltransferase family protein [Gammaproteobacteria bacterium]